MERSDKHGARQDEALARETEALVRAGRSGRAEEWRDPEPSGEDQPEADFAPNTTLTGGIPDGLTPEGLERRSELAAHLGRDVYPASRAQLVDRLVENNAPDRLITVVRDLPDDAQYQNAGELASALGWGHESHRF